jgi:hypothetical protein
VAYHIHCGPHPHRKTNSANAVHRKRSALVRSKRNDSNEKFLTGKEAKCWRMSRGLTQPEVANWLGLSPQAISIMERRGASRVMALALAAIDRGLQPMKPGPDDCVDTLCETQVEAKGEDRDESE